MEWLASLGSNRSWRALSCASALGIACLLARPASAATDEEKAGARAAATQGEQAFEQKRWGDALDLFTRAESLVHSPVHLLYKARSLVQLGRLVKAHEAYMAVIHDTIPPNAPPVIVKAQASAREEDAALAPRLASLSIKVEGGTGGEVAVTIDGARVPPALVGLANPADPGEHKLQATADGMQSDVVTITIKEGTPASATLTLKPAPGVTLPGAAPPSATPATAPAAGAPPPPPPSGAAPAAPAAPAAHKTPTGVYVGLAATGALAVGGAVVGVMALSKHSDFNSHNDGSDAAHANDLKSSGKTLNLVTDVLVGGALVAAGVTLAIYLGHKDEAAPATALHLSPAVGPGVGGLNLQGQF